MAYPICFKLINRATGEEVRGGQSAILFPDGTPALMRQDFYTYVDKVSCADYELWVAVEKDPTGKWLFRQVGH